MPEGGRVERRDPHLLAFNQPLLVFNKLQDLKGESFASVFVPRVLKLQITVPAGFEGVPMLQCSVVQARRTSDVIPTGEPVSYYVDPGPPIFENGYHPFLKPSSKSAFSVLAGAIPPVPLSVAAEARRRWRVAAASFAALSAASFFACAAVAL